MAKSLLLPRAGGAFYEYASGEAASFAVPAKPFTGRIAFSAAHVVCDPFADADPLHHARIDWNATLAYRHHCGPLASPWRRRWIPRSAAWASIGTARRSLFALRSRKRAR